MVHTLCPTDDRQSLCQDRRIALPDLPITLIKPARNMQPVGVCQGG